MHRRGLEAEEDRTQPASGFVKVPIRRLRSPTSAERIVGDRGYPSRACTGKACGKPTANRPHPSSRMESGLAR
jgi:hypothetical protein